MIASEEDRFYVGIVKLRCVCTSFGEWLRYDSEYGLLMQAGAPHAGRRLRYYWADYVGYMIQTK